VYLLPQSDPFYASILASLAVAKASGETIVVSSGAASDHIMASFQ
jgi:hypothetical protein